MLLNEAWNFYRETSTEEEEKKHCGLVKFIQDNQHPSSDDIEDFAKRMGVPVMEVEERMFSLLSTLVRGVGKHNDVPDEFFDDEQLEKGIAAEKEHTSDELVAKMIAKDHLMEIPDYYDRLDKMEDQAEDEPEKKFSIKDLLNKEETDVSQGIA